MVLSLSTANPPQLIANHVPHPLLNRKLNCVSLYCYDWTRHLKPKLLSHEHWTAQTLSWLQRVHTCLTEVMSLIERERVIKGGKGKQRTTITAGFCCLVTGTEVTLRFFPLIPVSYDVDLQLPSMSFTMSGGTALVEMSYMQVTAKVKHILCFLFGILCTRTYFICIRYSGCWDEFLGSEESGGPGAGLLVLYMWLTLVPTLGKASPKQRSIFLLYHFKQLLFFLGWA